MKPSLKRMISAVVSLFLIVAAVVIFTNYIKPEYATLEQNKATVSAQQEEIKNKNNIDQLISGQGKEYERGKNYLKAFEVILPLTPAVDAALAQLTGLAVKNNVSLLSMSISETAPVVSESARKNPNTLEAMIDKSRIISFTISATGGYSEFKNLLKDLEHNMRIFDVKDVSVQPVGPGGTPLAPKGQAQAPIYNYSLTVQTYYQPI